MINFLRRAMLNHQHQLDWNRCGDRFGPKSKQGCTTVGDNFMSVILLWCRWHKLYVDDIANLSPIHLISNIRHQHRCNHKQIYGCHQQNCCLEIGFRTGSFYVSYVIFGHVRPFLILVLERSQIRHYKYC